VPAGSDFEIKRAVHFVLLCPEYGGQILRHFNIGCSIYSILALQLSERDKLKM
jgi:hypothetical protein